MPKLYVVMSQRVEYAVNGFLISPVTLPMELHKLVIRLAAAFTVREKEMALFSSRPADVGRHQLMTHFSDFAAEICEPDRFATEIGFAHAAKFLR